MTRAIVLHKGFSCPLYSFVVHANTLHFAVSLHNSHSDHHTIPLNAGEFCWTRHFSFWHPTTAILTTWTWLCAGHGRVRLSLVTSSYQNGCVSRQIINVKLFFDVPVLRTDSWRHRLPPRIRINRWAEMRGPSFIPYQLYNDRLDLSNHHVLCFTVSG